MDSQSPWLYDGPRFNYTYTSLSNTTVFLRKACKDFYGPGVRQWVYGVANCVINNLSEQMKANLSMHTYLVTLWPAFVSIIVAMAPDAAPVAYDNIAWATVFALTSAGMPGFNAPPLPHQLTFAELAAAQRTCETASVDGSEDPSKISRYSAARPAASYTRTAAVWGLCLASFGIWAAFVILYLVCLSSVINLAADLLVGYGAVWYLIGAGPGLADVTARLVLNNVDVYEPVGASRQSTVEPFAAATVSEVADATQPATTIRLVKDPNAAPAYEHKTFPTGIHAWMRILHMQLTGRPYRVLVHPLPDTILTGVFQYLILMGRLTIFVWGSLVQGSFLFLFPNDFQLLVLLVFATATPRAIWPDMWKRAKGGADLVVWWKPIL